MSVEFLTYVVTFIISSGVAVIGILTAYQLYHSEQKQILQILLYQQIFIFSFFTYGIWGNLVIREIITDLNLIEELNRKLALFIPLLGVPFLLVSWFMLLKFGYNLCGYKFSKIISYSYFPFFLALITGITGLIQKNLVQLPSEPDLFVVRLLVILNFFIQVFYIIPFLRPSENLYIKQFGLKKIFFLYYFMGVVISSLALSFFDVFGFISICLSIILIFALSTFFPVIIKFKMKSMQVPSNSKHMDFISFCTCYEISKRESEIILEICSGRSNKAISEKLFITLQTVKDHTHRIYTKTGVKSRVQLANLVREKTGEYV